MVCHRRPLMYLRHLRETLGSKCIRILCPIRRDLMNDRNIFLNTYDFVELLVVAATRLADLGLLGFILAIREVVVFVESLVVVLIELIVLLAYHPAKRYGL